jgi:hypothetical protein
MRVDENKIFPGSIQSGHRILEPDMKAIKFLSQGLGNGRALVTWKLAAKPSWERRDETITRVPRPLRFQ